MTPKEKAEELIKNYRAINFTTGNNSKMIASYEDCKQCALIAVNEILQIKSITMYPVLEDNYIYGHEEYWQKVKEKIEKL
jgi:hypothetical protein